MSNELSLETWLSETRKLETDCGSFYVTVLFDVDDLKPEGMIIKVGKGSSCLNTIMSVIDISIGKILKDEGIVSAMSFLRNKECQSPTMVKGKVVYKSCLHGVYLWLDEIRHSYNTGEVLKLYETEQI